MGEFICRFRGREFAKDGRLELRARAADGNAEFKTRSSS